MATTFDVFYLGSHASIDPTEGNDLAENAASLVGQTFGSEGDPLHQKIQEMAPGSTGFGGGNTTAYDQNNSISSDTFTIDGGGDQTFDATAAYDLTLNYSDGTSATITGVIFQDTIGNTYLAPEFSANNDQIALEAKAIESITIDTLVGDLFAGTNGEREAGTYETPDGTIDGTSGDDTIDASYGDVDGDKVDGFDGDNDIIDGGAGDDLVYGGAGNDSIEGGAGNDLLVGGDGDDTLAGGAGADSFQGGAGLDIADFSSSGAGVSVNLETNSFSGGDAAGDSAVGVDGIIGSAFDDTLTGYDGQGVDYTNILYGGSGDDAIDGRAGDDTLYGGDGNDTITGGLGADTLTGGAGNDVIYTGEQGTFTNDQSITVNSTVDAGSGNDHVHVTEIHNIDASIDGGDGIDTIYFDFNPADFGGTTLRIDLAETGYTQPLNGIGGDEYFTNFENIVTGDGNDSVTGNTADNVLTTGAGDDFVDGDEGNDLLYAGAGVDTIVGGSGADTIFAGAGNDTVEAGTGHDTIEGGDGADSIDGGSNNDRLYGGDGDDTLDGGVGIDSLYGGAGNDLVQGGGNTGNADRVYGGDGNDTVIGGDGAGQDTLYGDAGNDTLDGQRGADTLYAGDGDDTIQINDDFGDDTIFGGEGGADNDTLDLSALGAGVTVTYTGDEQGTFTDGSDTGTFFGIENVILTEQDDNFDASNDTVGVTVDGRGGNDTLITGDGSDTIEGGSGNDTIDGGGQTDTLYGGAGTDTLDGGVQADLLYGGADADSIIANFGTDTVYGGTGNDSIEGSSGDDAIYGGDGDDSIDGGSDDDVIYGGDGNDAIDTGNLLDTAYGGDGDDLLFNGSGGTSQATLFGGLGNDTLETGTGDAADVLFGGDGDDVLNDRGTDGDQTLTGGAGSDTITSAAGDDLVYGGDDQDTILIKDDFGADTIYGGEGGTDSDTLDLSALGTGITVTYIGDEQGTFSDGTDTGTFFGIENVILTDQDDNFDATNDTVGVSVDGGGGNDIIAGGDGNDRIDGGTGNDTLSSGDGRDYVDGGVGNDSITGGNSVGGSQTLLGDAGNDSIDGGGGYDIVYGGTGDDSIADSGGSGSQDKVYGGDGSDAIDAGAGDDTVYGGTGDDTVFGDAGDDLQFGDAGNDILGGEAGNDILTGGSGDDTFVLSNNGGDDAVTDFGDGSDQLDITALTDVGNALTDQDGTVTADEVTVSGGGGSDQLLTFPSGETVTVPDGTVDTSTQATQFASLVAMGVPPCFAPGTLILTPDGERPVEDLCVGDLLVTADHGAQPLRWIGRRDVDFRDPDNDRGEKDKPILLSAGSLGANSPWRDLIVSPQHRMVLMGRAVEAVFGTPEVMTIAKALTGLPGIRRMKGKRQITYFALLLDRHEVIYAERAATESFRPGPVSLDGFTPENRAEICQIYPGLVDDPETALGPPARPILSRAETEILVKKIASTIVAA